MSQKDAVLFHLKDDKQNNSITPLVALQAYGCFRLADVIYQLRNMGWAIETNMIASIGMNGEPKRFAQYVLKSKRKGPEMVVLWGSRSHKRGELYGVKA